MVKGKLILICQSGGEFTTKDDGSMLYTGGDANAIYITHETSFEDLKLELSEMWNVDSNSVSLKYFLPGNKRIPINLRNDKDLSRMMEIHKNSVSTDIFVLGKPGICQADPNTHVIRKSDIKVARTLERVSAVSSSAPRTNIVSVPVTASTDSPSFVDLLISMPDDLMMDKIVPSLCSFSSEADMFPDNASSDGSLYNVPIKMTESQKRVVTDVNDSPADTVKKRRRASTWKIGTNGCLTLASNNCQAEDIVESQQEPPIDFDFDSLSNPGDLSLENVVSSWKDGIVGVGQEFKSVKQFRDVLQKYAIANKFVYKLKKNDSSRVSGRCVVVECSWRIHASWVQSSQVFSIKKMNDMHTCEGASWKSARPGKNWLVSMIKRKLQATPHLRPKEIAKSLFDDFGIQFNYSQVWRGIEDARGLLQFKDTYNQFPSCCKRILCSNPGSVVKLETHDDKSFQRLFLSFHASIHGFQNGCRPLIFLDSMSLKSKCHETLLYASAVDGADECFPVACAIIDVENSDTWCWFLQQLRSSISTPEPLTFVSNRELGLKNLVLEIFSNAFVGYSLYHLMEEFKKNLVGPFNGDGRGALPTYFTAAAQAHRVDGFKKAAEQIKQVSSSAYEWIMHVEPECWTDAHFNGESYSQINSNVTTELFSKWVEDICELPINQKIQALTSLMAYLMSSRQAVSSNWSSKLTPLKEEQLRAEAAGLSGLKVFHSTNILFEVQDDFSNHVVNIATRDCTCLRWKKSGLPCRHTIAVFNSEGLDIYNYCQKWFFVESYRLAYANSINPLQGSEEEEEIDAMDEVTPPIIANPPPRQPKQVQTQREPKRTVVCTKCKEPGHNKVTCIKG